MMAGRANRAKRLGVRRIPALLLRAVRNSHKTLKYGAINYYLEKP